MCPSGLQWVNKNHIILAIDDYRRQTPCKQIGQVGAACVTQTCEQVSSAAATQYSRILCSPAFKLLRLVSITGNKTFLCSIPSVSKGDIKGQMRIWFYKHILNSVSAVILYLCPVNTCAVSQLFPLVFVRLALYTYIYIKI